MKSELKITNLQELQDASELSIEDCQQRGDLVIDGIFVDEKESDLLACVICAFDPLNIVFTNCNFQIGSFDGIFDGPKGVESVTIMNSNLTAIQAKGLLMSICGDWFKYLNLSHNNLGKDPATFFDALKEAFIYFGSIRDVDLSDNGFAKKDITKFEKKMKKIWPYYDITIKS